MQQELTHWHILTFCSGLPHGFQWLGVLHRGAKARCNRFPPPGQDLHKLHKNGFSHNVHMWPCRTGLELVPWDPKPLPQQVLTHEAVFPPPLLVFLVDALSALFWQVDQQVHHRPFLPRSDSGNIHRWHWLIDGCKCCICVVLVPGPPRCMCMHLVQHSCCHDAVMFFLLWCWGFGTCAYIYTCISIYIYTPLGIVWSTWHYWFSCWSQPFPVPCQGATPRNCLAKI